MPKIIEDIEVKIFTSAFSLFCELGFEKTDMKKIASNAGIAVGTLYNYFPNKKELFFKIIMKSWQETFEKMDKTISEDKNPIEKLKTVLITFYANFEGRQGIGSELARSKILEEYKPEFDKFIKKGIYTRGNILFREISEITGVTPNEDLKNRIIESLFILCGVMFFHHKEDESENIRFIEFMVDRLVR